MELINLIHFFQINDGDKVQAYMHIHKCRWFGRYIAHVRNGNLFNIHAIVVLLKCKSSKPLEEMSNNANCKTIKNLARKVIGASSICNFITLPLWFE